MINRFDPDQIDFQTNLPYNRYNYLRGCPQSGGKEKPTIITPCFQIAALLSENPDSCLILTGDILRSGELPLVGHLAKRAFQDFFADKLYLGAAGIDYQPDLTEFNLEITLA